ncbi:hypothetical protein K435DRAFT_971829 [Dendrothele bispora CBS 962.96]|uniref:Uncharacterized protein n=1 Tax=Dendrothele bispora (strain CBS 962.96) TaxID=1314807 RepID=A0A4S8L365_DENBC|nr:hypothetical protein K435DRAFT_971829 [Dendrothele bispora CBS 962.96]
MSLNLRESRYHLHQVRLDKNQLLPHPTLPPTVFQTPPPRQLVLTSPPTPPPPHHPHHHTVGVAVAAKPTRHVRYRPTPVHHMHPHPYAHAYHHQRTTTRPQQQQISPLSPISTNNNFAAPIATVQGQPLSTNPSGPGSPLQSLFDHTSIRILRDISHLQTSCYAVLHNERREKEVMRVKMMRMKRERDLAWERLRGVKGLPESTGRPLVNVVAQNTHARQSLKRHRSDGDVDDMMVSMTAGLPTPPLSSDINKPPISTHGASALEIDSTGVDDSLDMDLDLDRYTLSYPSPYPNSYCNISSPSSPPPPPISGRRLFFDTSPSSNLSHNPTPTSLASSHAHPHDLSSPIHLASAKAKKKRGPCPLPLTADVLSHDPDNHEEYLRQRRGAKRRRIVIESETESSMSPVPVPFEFSNAQSSDKSSNGSGSGSGEDTLVDDHERRRTSSPSPSPYLSTSSKKEDAITSRILRVSPHISPPHLTTTAAALLATTLPGLPGGCCDSAAGRSSGYSSDSDCSGLGERDMDLESESDSDSDAESVEVPLALTLSSSYSMTKVDDDRSGRRTRVRAGGGSGDNVKGFELVRVKEAHVRHGQSTAPSSFSLEKEEGEERTSNTSSRKSPLQSVSSISISRTLTSTSTLTSTPTPTPALAPAPTSSSGPTQTPKTPSPSPNPKETSSSILKGLPKLDLKDLGQMFVQEGDRIHCRLCPRSESRSRSRSPPNAPSSSFPPTPANTPNLDAMIQHCTHSHPKAYSDVSGLSLDQVYMLRSVLGERSASASASLSSRS